MKKYGTYIVFFAAMLWATDSPFRLHLTQNLSSNFIVLGEHFVGTLFVLPLFIKGFSELKKLNYKDWLAAIFIGVSGSALASVAFTQAFHYVSPSVALLLQKLQPLIAIGLAAALLQETLSPKFWLWTAVALAGAYLITFPGLIPQEKLSSNLLGVGLALLAALFWGASTVLGKFVLNKIDFKMMTALRFIIGFMFLLILNFSTKSFPQFSAVSGLDWLFIFIIAVTSGVVSLFIYYKGLQYTKASIATLAELGYPAAAVLVNWYFLKLSLAPMQLVGMAILLFGVFRLSSENQDKSVVLQPTGVLE